VNLSVPYLGEILSLLAAVLWALAVIFFRKCGERVHPLALNSFKNLLALILFIPTMWLFGEAFFVQAPFTIYVIFMLSGVIGIGIGDTIFFHSLNRLGAGLTGIVVCMYSPFIIVLSILLLGERLTIVQILGALMIISAVLIATYEKRVRSIDRKQIVLGILLGILSSACMAIGVVMIKPLLPHYPLLWLTGVRLFGGSVALGVILLFYPARRKVVNSLVSTSRWTYTITGSFIGAFLAMIVWLGGMKYTQASIASALNQTSTIFIFIFAAFILREPINVRRILGIILAFIGSFLVSFG
jgi:drug/metabolite transporter (DMT)-like permease